MNRFEKARGIRLTRLIGAVALFCTILTASLLPFTRAQAAIELVYFEVATEPDRVRIEWETATELNNAGYYVLRSETGGSNPADYEQITVIDAASGDSFNFIPARGDDLFGAVYIFYDEAVSVGNRYYYFLQDVDSNNASSYHGPREVVVGQTSTPAPSVTPTTTTGPPTSTSPGPTATATATRTNTPFPGFVPTATPSISPTPTATPPFTETPTATETEIPPVDRTLTAIAAALTGFPTGTATTTPTPDQAGLIPTRTQRPSATPVPPEAEGRSLPIGRILLVVLIFLLSGGLLTVGIVYIARNSAGDDVTTTGSRDE